MLIVGSNPRKEAAVLNARIRKRWRAGKFPIGLIGPKADLTYTYDYLGAGPETLAAITRHAFADVLRKAERPLCCSAPALSRAPTARRSLRSPPKRRSISARSRTAGTAFPCLHSAASRVGALDLGFVPGAGRLERRGRWRRPARSMCCSCSAPTRSTSRPAPSSSTSAPTATAARMRADVVLPGAAYPEKSGIYVNTEGRVQMATRASFPPGDAREDWAILRALSDVLGKQAALRLARGACARRCSRRIRICMRIGQIAPADAADVAEARGARRHDRQGAVRIERSRTSISPIRSRARRR